MPKPAPSPTGHRRTVYPGVSWTFPDPLGERRIRFRNDDLGYVEDVLEDELDRLNDRIAAGRVIDPETGLPEELPYDSVWDALDLIMTRKPLRSLAILLTAGLAHTFADDPDQGRAEARAELVDVDPSIYNDEGLADAIRTSLAHAFGQDPEEADPEDPPTATGDDD